MGGYQDEERVPEIDFYLRPRYPIWIEALKVFLMFALGGMVILYAAFDLAGGGHSYTLFAAGFFVMPVLSTILRRWGKNIFVFLLPHGLFAAYIYFLSPDLILTSLGVLYLIALVLYGLVRQMSRQEEKDLSMIVLFAAVFVMMIIYGLAIYRGHGEYEKLLLGQGMVYVVLFLFYQHRISLITTLGTIDKGSNFSTRQVVGFNTRVFFVYMFMAVVLCVGLYLMGLGELLSIFGRWLLLMIRRLVRALVKVEPTPEAAEEEMVEEQQVQKDIGMVIGQGIETGAFWIFLQKILEVVVLIGLVVLVMWALYKLVTRFMGSYRYQGSGYEETRVSISRVPREKIRSAGFSLFDRSPENRIRREYWKRVKSAIDKTVRRSDTPREVAGKMPQVAEIVEDYQKVRYQKPEK